MFTLCTVRFCSRFAMRSAGPDTISCALRRPHGDGYNSSSKQTLQKT